jgi:hypothetical protein
MPERETKQRNKEKAVHKVTAAERTAADKHLARREAKPSVRLKVSKNASDPQIRFDHPDEQIGQALVMEALALTAYTNRRRRILQKASFRLLESAFCSAAEGAGSATISSICLACLVSWLFIGRDRFDIFGPCSPAGVAKRLVPTAARPELRG